MSRPPLLPAMLIPPLILVACSSGQPNQRGAVSRDTLPNGTVVVRYGELPAGEVVLAAIDLRIGEVEGSDPNFIFGDVRGIEAGRDGTIYVLDYQASEVRPFDTEGDSCARWRREARDRRRSARRTGWCWLATAFSGFRTTGSG